MNNVHHYCPRQNQKILTLLLICLYSADVPNSQESEYTLLVQHCAAFTSRPFN